MHKLFHSNRGNTAVFVMVLSSIVVLWMTTGVQKAIQYKNSKKKSELSSQAMGKSVNAAYFVREFFRINSTTSVPVLFPVPYPADLTSVPQVQTLGTLPAGITRLPANDPNCPNCFEFEFPKTSAIAQGTFETLFSSPQSALSRTGLTMSKVRVNFNKFTAVAPTPPATLSPNPRVVRSLVADVTSEYTPPGSQVTQTILSKLELQVDSPPAPTCQLSHSLAGRPNPGQQVPITFTSRSIIGSAQISADNGSTWTTISTMPANQSIASINFANAANTIGTYTYATPNQATWTLKARVNSVDATIPRVDCPDLVILTNWVPAPVCNALNANPIQLGTGDPSQVTLTCTGSITSMNLGDKGAEPAVAGTVIAGGRTYTGSFTLTAAQASRTLAGYATGPGGISNKPEITIAKYPQCPFTANAYYRKTLIGGDGKPYPMQVATHAAWGPLLNRYSRRYSWSAAYWPASTGADWYTPAAPSTAQYADEMDIMQGASNPRYDHASGGGLPCGVGNLCMFAFYARIPTLRDSSLNQVYYNGNIYKHVGYMAAEFGPTSSPNCTLIRSVQRAYGCFREGTLILNAKKHWVPIETLGKGDFVWNPLRNKAQRIKRAVRGPEKIPLIRLITSQGILDVTTQHPFFTANGMVTAEEIDERAAGILRLGTSELEGMSSVAIGPDEKVWNIELEGSHDPMDHALLANGMVTGDLYLQEAIAKKRVTP